MAGVDYQLYITANIQNTEEVKAKLKKLEEKEISLKFNAKDSEKLLEKLNKQKDAYRKEVDTYLDKRMKLEEKAYKQEQDAIEESRKLREQANKENLDAIEKNRKANEKAEKEKRKSQKETDAIEKKAEKERQKEIKASADEALKAQKELNQMRIQASKYEADPKETGVRLKNIQYEIEQQQEITEELNKQIRLQLRGNELQEYENNLKKEEAQTERKITDIMAKPMDVEKETVSKNYLAEIKRIEKALDSLNIPLKEQVILREKLSKIDAMPRNSIQEINKATEELEELNREIGESVIATNKFAESMSKATATAIGIGTASMALMTLSQAMVACVQTAYQLETQMTQLMMVTGQTKHQVEELSQGYADMANSLGATMSQVMTAANEFLLTRASI